MRIIGIDPSLTATGLALIDTEDRIVPESWIFTTKALGWAPTIEDRLTRLDRIVGHITALDFDYALIEAPSLGAGRQAGTFERAGLWWSIARKLDDAMIPTVEVPPATLKKYATGKGNASKDAVLLAVARRYPHVEIPDNNAADALVLAAIGFDHITGHPLVDLPKVNRTALDGITFPDTRRAA